MTTSRKLFALAVLAASAGTAVPATADAPIQVEQRPFLVHQGGAAAQVIFETDRALPRKARGGIDATVRFQGGTTSVATYRKSIANSYTSTVRGQKALAGGHYKLTIKVAGQPAYTTKVTLRRQGTSYLP
jgi:hypothetical protein